jgi:hypothetical protein
MLEKSNIKHLGEVAIFYLPKKKINKKIRKEIHNFFVDNYNAYTHELSTINGYWSKKNKIIKDKHERYEVSFCGKKNFEKFIDFLSYLRKKTKEESIYLVISEESFLIK